ncbi:hypothetical protein QYF36_012773 [Acer negundo]|nr:hypothetical protein QYF36_012773 [Acer negundo]
MGSCGEKFGEISVKRKKCQLGIAKDERFKKAFLVSTEEDLVSSNCFVIETREKGSCSDEIFLDTDKRCSEDVPLQNWDTVATHFTTSMRSINEETSDISADRSLPSKDFLGENFSKVQVKYHQIFSAPPLCSYWILPKMGQLKMNCATAFDRQMENTGIGVLVKDSEGEVLGCCSQTLETILSMNVAHHLTIQKGIQFGVDYGFLLNVFEMDDAKCFTVEYGMMNWKRTKWLANLDSSTMQMYHSNAKRYFEKSHAAAKGLENASQSRYVFMPYNLDDQLKSFEISWKNLHFAKGS